jgi:hypothetical protein
MENLWQSGERCQGQKLFSGVRNVSKIKWSPSQKNEVDLLWVWIDAHVVVGLKSFSPLSSKTGRSFGTSPNHRQYEIMYLNNFLILIFRVRLVFDQDGSCPEIGNMI